jgi:cyanobactin maturation PatA/PatG family protease
MAAGFKAPVRLLGSGTASDGVRAAGLEPYEAGRVAKPAPPDILIGTSPQSGEPNQGGDTTVQESVSTLESPAAVADVPAIPAEDSAQPIGAGAPATLSAQAGVTPACADGDHRALKPAGGCGCQGVRASEGEETAEAAAAKTVAVATAAAAVTPSYVYALGTVGFDFGTEARRDTFRQLMPDIMHDQAGTLVSVAPNPYDAFQLSDYLNARPSESTKLIWTLNLDLTPIYALEAEIAYPEDVYGTLRHALANQALPEDDSEHIAKVSIPGVLASRSVRLFSGQVLPVVVVQPRGLYEWSVRALIDQVIDAIAERPEIKDSPAYDEQRVRRLVRIFLDKVYFQCRNLGAAPADRALNFAATNAFQFASGIAQGLLSGDIVPSAGNSLYSLDSIDVRKSPYCRMDSDCWDVLITWFDPENERRAKSIYQFTIDVSDELPVSLAPAHQYLAT